MELQSSAREATEIFLVVLREIVRTFNAAEQADLHGRFIGGQPTESLLGVA
jgi:hypothetical protein